MNDPGKRKIPPRFVISLVSPRKEWHMVKHKKFPQKLTRTQNKRM